MTVMLATVTTKVAINRPPSSASKTGGKNRLQESNSTPIYLTLTLYSMPGKLPHDFCVFLLHFSSLLSPSTASVVTNVHWTSTINSLDFFIMLWLWKGLSSRCLSCCVKALKLMSLTRSRSWLSKLYIRYSSVTRVSNSKTGWRLAYFSVSPANSHWPLLSLCVGTEYPELPLNDNFLWPSAAFLRGSRAFCAHE